MRLAGDQRRQRKVELPRGLPVELRKGIPAYAGAVAAHVPPQLNLAARTGVLEGESVGESGGDKAVLPGQVMRPALGDTGRANGDGAEPLETAVEQAAARPDYGSEREQGSGGQPEAPLHVRKRLDQSRSYRDPTRPSRPAPSG